MYSMVLGTLLLSVVLAGCATAPSNPRTLPAPAQTPPARTPPAQTAPAQSPASPTPASSAPAKPAAEQSNEKTDSGRYVGQIDANSIEIKISGVPDAQAARAFRLSEELKVSLPKMGIKKDQNIKFTYTFNANGQPVITSIQKI